jgi:hypothetical protein
MLPVVGIPGSGAIEGWPLVCGVAPGIESRPMRGNTANASVVSTALASCSQFKRDGDESLCVRDPVPALGLSDGVSGNQGVAICPQEVVKLLSAVAVTQFGVRLG